MKSFVIILALVGLVYSETIPYSGRAALLAYSPARGQFQADYLNGRYSYGYFDGLTSKSEVRSPDGVTRGFYRYVDPNGIPQSVTYMADSVNGFRVSGIPVGKVEETPEVAAARAEHLAAFELVRNRGESFGALAKAEKLSKLPMEDMNREAMRPTMMNEKMKEDWSSMPAMELPKQVKDTPEVEMAKKEHFLAHEMAMARLELAKKQVQPQIFYDNYLGTPLYYAPVGLKTLPTGFDLKAQPIAAQPIAAQPIAAPFYGRFAYGFNLPYNYNYEIREPKKVETV